MTVTAPFSIAVSRAPGRTVIAVTGELDVYTAPALKERAIDVLDDLDGGDIIVDLAEMTFIDSTGLGVLVGIVRRLRGTDSQLSLRNPTPGTARVLEITGLTEVLPIRQ